MNGTSDRDEQAELADFIKSTPPGVLEAMALIDWPTVAHNRSLRPDDPGDYEDGETAEDCGDEVAR